MSQENNNNKLDIYDDLEIVDANDEKAIKEKNIDTDRTIIQPTGCESKINDYMKEILKEYGNDIPPEILAELQYNNTAKTFASPQDIGCRDKIDNLDNQVRYNDTDITIRKLKAKPKKTNPESIRIAMADAFGVGSLTHIPLYHSGFWITLKPLTNEEKVTLYLELAKELDRLGKKTHDLIYIHTTALFTRIIKEYVKSKIVRTSLKLEKDEDIFDYITLPDVNLIMWGILKSLYPKGYNFTIECKNALKIDDTTKKPLCTFKGITTNVDFSKMLWVDKSLLDDKQLEIMSRRVDNSVSVEEVKDYQESIESINEQIITKTTTNEDGETVTLNVNLKVPSINEFLVSAEYTLNKIEEKIAELIADGSINDDEESRAKIETELGKSIELHFYNHYVRSINFNGITMDTVDGINAALEILTDTPELRNEIKEAITRYINGTEVAIIGMPDFTCPVCKEKQSDRTDNFKSFIAFDVFMYFFILLASRYQTIIQNQ